MKPFVLDEKHSVLIISEDDAKSSAILHLCEQRWPVVEADVFESGIKALASCRKKIYDVIICDYRTKFLDGWKFVKEFKNHMQIENMPVILFSHDQGKIDEDLKKRKQTIIEYSVTSILLYPFTKNKLFGAIEDTRSTFEQEGSIEDLYTKAKHASIYEENGSEKMFEKIYEQSPEFSRSNLAMTNVYKKTGNTEKMNFHLEKACEADSDNLPARYLQFEIATDNKNGEKKGEIIRSLLDDPGDDLAVILYNLAQILYLRDLFQETTALIEGNSDDSKALPVYLKLILVKSRLKDNQLEQANRDIEKILADGVENVEVMNLAAIIARKLKHYDIAIKYYIRALRKAPSDYRIMFNLAITYRADGQYEKANEYANLVIEIEPTFHKASEFIKSLAS